VRDLKADGKSIFTEYFRDVSYLLKSPLRILSDAVTHSKVDESLLLLEEFINYLVSKVNESIRDVPSYYQSIIKTNIEKHLSELASKITNLKKLQKEKQ